jgi:hypothetical protein
LSHLAIKVQNYFAVVVKSIAILLKPVPAAIPASELIEMVKLSKVNPTPEEIQHARSILDGLDQKAQRSKMASMIFFLQQNPENEEAANH